MKDVNIYIHTEYQGSLSKGSGKWHVILETIAKNKNEHEELKTLKGMGCVQETTKNRLELLALAKGLGRMKQGSRIKVYTTSDYIANAFINEWLDRWAKENFRTRKKPVKHADLWKKVYEQIEKHNVTVMKSMKTSYMAVQESELKQAKEGEVWIDDQGRIRKDNGGN